MPGRAFRGRRVLMGAGMFGLALLATPAFAQTTMQTPPQRPQLAPPSMQAPAPTPPRPDQFPAETRTWSGEHRPRHWGPPYWGPPGPSGWYDPYYPYYPYYPPPAVYIPGRWVWTGYNWAWVPGRWEYQFARPW